MLEFTETWKPAGTLRRTPASAVKIATRSEGDVEVYVPGVRKKVEVVDVVVNNVIDGTVVREVSPRSLSSSYDRLTGHVQGIRETRAWGTHRLDSSRGGCPRRTSWHTERQRGEARGLGGEAYRR